MSVVVGHESLLPGLILIGHVDLWRGKYSVCEFVEIGGQWSGSRLFKVEVGTATQCHLVLITRGVVEDWPLGCRKVEHDGAIVSDENVLHSHEHCWLRIGGDINHPFSRD